jgi:hypothetical protein
MGNHSILVDIGHLYLAFPSDWLKRLCPVCSVLHGYLFSTCTITKQKVTAVLFTLNMAGTSLGPAWMTSCEVTLATLKFWSLKSEGR